MSSSFGHFSGIHSRTDICTPSRRAEARPSSPGHDVVPIACWVDWMDGTGCVAVQQPTSFPWNLFDPWAWRESPPSPPSPPPPQLSASPIGRSTLAFCGPCPARFFCSQRGRGRRWSTARGRVRFVDSLLSPPLVPATPAEAFVWGLGVGGQISAASDWSRLLS